MSILELLETANGVNFSLGVLTHMVYMTRLILQIVIQLNLGRYYPNLVKLRYDNGNNSSNSNSDSDSYSGDGSSSDFYYYDNGGDVVYVPTAVILLIWVYFLSWPFVFVYYASPAVERYVCNTYFFYLRYHQSMDAQPLHQPDASRRFRFTLQMIHDLGWSFFLKRLMMIYIVTCVPLFMYGLWALVLLQTGNYFTFSFIYIYADLGLVIYLLYCMSQGEYYSFTKRESRLIISAPDPSAATATITAATITAATITAATITQDSSSSSLSSTSFVNQPDPAPVSTAVLADDNNSDGGTDFDENSRILAPINATITVFTL